MSSDSRARHRSVSFDAATERRLLRQDRAGLQGIVNHHQKRRRLPAKVRSLLAALGRPTPTLNFEEKALLAELARDKSAGSPKRGVWAASTSASAGGDAGSGGAAAAPSDDGRSLTAPGILSSMASFDSALATSLKETFGSDTQGLLSSWYEFSRLGFFSTPYPYDFEVVTRKRNVNVINPAEPRQPRKVKMPSRFRKSTAVLESGYMRERKEEHKEIERLEAEAVEDITPTVTSMQTDEDEAVHLHPQHQQQQQHQQQRGELTVSRGKVTLVLQKKPPGGSRGLYRGTTEEDIQAAFVLSNMSLPDGCELYPKDEHADLLAAGQGDGRQGGDGKRRLARKSSVTDSLPLSLFLASKKRKLNRPVLHSGGGKSPPYRSAAAPPAPVLPVPPVHTACGVPMSTRAQARQQVVATAGGHS
ncbi:unnamed protein product [Vitrella brassicaformis CCMP3155]|uniref:Uncharacterized protein n=1 Tax=Vitrella brassicaformis (strain CCMP3155) TaxID=1169540 RepID=A0A0G4EC32_VITBC|nr:unnamed protein product [Vitrella brassicaformis CCMP3155]|eukprot:CEL92886.1 unnamed protein product [Vitrella brassicaformis CCMP3155]